jgi:hypothetical protein
MGITGEHATLVSFSSVFGRKEKKLRKFEIGEIGAYAQYSISITIKGLNPGKQKWWFIRVVPDNITYFLIEDREGRVLCDSREAVPCDMEAWQATQAEMRRRFPSRGGAA